MRVQFAEGTGETIYDRYPTGVIRILKYFGMHNRVLKTFPFKPYGKNVTTVMAWKSVKYVVVPGAQREVITK